MALPIPTYVLWQACDSKFYFRYNIGGLWGLRRRVCELHVMKLCCERTKLSTKEKHMAAPEKSPTHFVEENAKQASKTETSAQDSHETERP